MTATPIDERVRSLAAVAADEPAILDGDRTTTWAELAAVVERSAAALRSAGVQPGDVVTVPAEPAVAAMTWILGALRAGAAVAPLDRRLTAAERERAMTVLDPVLEIAADGAIRGGGATGRRLAGPAIVVMTSGTTGRPKGVILSPGAMDASARAWLSALPPATGWLLALGTGHVAGLGIVWRSIAAGVPMRVADGTDPGAILAALGKTPLVSHVSLVPAQLARLLDASGDPPPGTLRAVPLGGGRIPAALVMRAIDAGWPVVPTYGLSEAGSGVTALPSAEAHEAPGSAGRPLPGVQVTIDEPDANGIGEIVVSTPGAFDGYVGDSPREPGTPIRTGDLGRLDAVGRLDVVDRRTDRIVRGGENISPAEVEAVLEAHPAIAEAAVVGRPDPVWGQVPVAAVVVAAGTPNPGSTALAAHVRTSLAAFKVPVSFVRVPALPRTGGGKLRRAEVRGKLGRPIVGSLVRPDGTRIGWRTTGTGAVTMVLLHGTLSTAAQLDRLAVTLAQPGDVTVLAVDRRGSGSSRMHEPSPVDVATHIDDLLAVLDHEGLGVVDLVGLSYGAVVALETAARHPERVGRVVAWEPPYGPLADAQTRDWFAALADSTSAAHRTGGTAAAAETFMRAVAGDRAWDRLPDRARAFLASEGDGALADAALLGLDPDGLAGITVPVTLLTGSTSEPFYAPIARAVTERVPGARQVELDDLDHAAPLTEPVRMAAAIRDHLEPHP